MLKIHKKNKVKVQEYPEEAVITMLQINNINKAKRRFSLNKKVIDDYEIHSKNHFVTGIADVDENGDTIGAYIMFSEERPDLSVHTQTSEIGSTTDTFSNQRLYEIMYEAYGQTGLCDFEMILANPQTIEIGEKKFTCHQLLPLQPEEAVDQGILETMSYGD